MSREPLSREPLSREPPPGSSRHDASPGPELSERETELSERETELSDGETGTLPAAGGRGSELAPDAAGTDSGSGTVGAYATVPPPGGEAVDQPSVWPEGTLVAERFRVKKFIGKGGMGTVYLAHDEMLGRPVALKRIPPEILYDGDARDDLRQEANRLLDLAHENIVRVHTYYDSPGYGDAIWPFIAMEYLQGPNLKSLLRERTQLGHRFSVAEVLGVARQVCRGLSHAHAKGIVHRDLKPSNLMLAEPPQGPLVESDVVKITDFGISRVIADSTLRHTGKRSGTLPYMSPEQLRGEPCTRRSDVYSLACTLYELLVGTPPFHTGDIAYQIVSIDPRCPDEVSRPIAMALLKGLAKDPRARFDSVEEFVEALEGKRRVWFRPLGRKGRIALDAARIGAPLALLFLLVWTFAGVGDSRRGSEDDRSGRLAAERSERPVVAPQRVEAFRLAKDVFKRYVRDQLTAQIPLRLGRRHAQPDGSASQAFEIRLPTSPSDLEQHLFEGLLFQCNGKHPPVRMARRSRQGDRWLFELDQLVTGKYTLTASVRGLDDKPAELDTYRFEVDLVPPQLSIRPLDPSALVEILQSEGAGEPPRFLTFHPVVEVQPLCEDAEETLAETAYRIAGIGDTWRRLEGPYLRVVLPERGEVTYEFKADDLAGNASPPVRAVFRRLHLELVSFSLASPDGVVGNLATVKGIARIEGRQRPDLKFFVNEKPVPNEFAEGLGQWDLPLEAPERAEIVSLPFTARLRISAARNNAIDVRYVWNDREPMPFDRQIRILHVDVSRPKVTLLQDVDRTSDTRLTLRGTVEPVFDGLEVLLELVGKGSSRVVLTPTSLGTAATFQHEVQLWPGEKNTMRFVSFYRGDRLPDAVDVDSFTIHCDTEPPRLARPVEFETRESTAGSLLYVTAYSSEPLRQLRIKATSDDDPTSGYRDVERLPGTSAYRFIAKLPRAITEFEIEMTDIVGLQEVVRARYIPQQIEIAAAVGSLPSSRTEGVERSARNGVYPHSPFVRSMGMEFLPFGFSRERLEMSVTEVPELPWRRFLSDEKGYDVEPFGRTEKPMVIGEEAPELLVEFAAWYERNAADGYTYFIPTVVQWKLAFSGASDPQEANAEILEWFRDGRADYKRFNRDPSERYGKNKVNDIGSRRENRTPTGFLDMESNVQEIVLDGGIFSVLGGYNRLTEIGSIEEHCLKPRAYSQVKSSQSESLTGFRLCRKLARTD